MADGSAAALAEILLGSHGALADEPLAAALSSDPPLLLWTVCVAARHDGLEPASVHDVAQWLSQRGLDVLQWEPISDIQPQQADAAQAEAFADCVADAAAVADLARQLAAPEVEAAVRRAFLLGLLHDSKRWLALAAEGSADETATCLPAWLRQLHQETTPEATAVRLAAAMLASQTLLLDSAVIDVDACRHRAAEVRRRWLAPLAGLADCLPLLVKRLARLAELETRFQQAVETEKLEAMAEFAAGAGHEINNPLTVIAGRAQLFLQEETDPERRRALALISAQAMRVYEMIADMRLFARPPRPEIEPVDVVRLVDRLIDDFSPRAARQETALRRVGESEPIEIEADPTQLAVALGALCQNALEALGGGGWIEISVHRSGTGVAIQVADDGPGITPEQRRHLFDPFYSARQAGRGLGLGLSKCWRIVTNHRGRIEVDSQPGRGATFTITLPQHCRMRNDE
jgi:hypothetical protein